MTDGAGNGARVSAENQRGRELRALTAAGAGAAVRQKERALDAGLLDVGRADVGARPVPVERQPARPAVVLAAARRLEVAAVHRDPELLGAENLGEGFSRVMIPYEKYVGAFLPIGRTNGLSVDVEVGAVAFPDGGEVMPAEVLHGVQHSCRSIPRPFA